MTKELFPGRWTSRAEDDFVVFLIGMRVNKPLAFSKWRPVAKAMPAMQQELARHPELGCVHTENWFGRTTISLQYWRDFESLRSYARNPDQAHLPAWRAFNQAIRDNGTVGIWHETYRVHRGESEAIYGTCRDSASQPRSNTSRRRRLETAQPNESVPTQRTTPLSNPIDVVFELSSLFRFCFVLTKGTYTYGMGFRSITSNRSRRGTLNLAAHPRAWLRDGEGCAA